MDRNLVSGVMICGDFNQTEVTWDEDFIPFTFIRDFNSGENGMIESLKDAFFVQNVNFPTFVNKENRCKNTLDYVITESIDRILCIKSNPPLGEVKQGHVVLEWNYSKVSSPKETEYSSRKLNFFKANFVKIYTELSNQDWLKMFHNKSISDMFNIFVEEIHQICSRNSPSRDLKRKTKPKWLNNNDIKDKIKTKNKLWSKCKQSNFQNKNLLIKYKIARNECSKVIDKAVRVFEYSLAKQAKTKPKLIYNYINGKKTIRGGLDAIKVGDELVTDRKAIVGTMNKYFKSIFNLYDSTEDEIHFPTRTEATLLIDPFVIF